MAARERGGIQAVIPWVALAVVTVFAFGQLHQRNRALDRAVKAEDDLYALKLNKGSPVPGLSGTPAPAKPPMASDGPTPRESKLDAALQASLDVNRADAKRLAELETERDEARVRGDRLAAALAAEKGRADAVKKRLAGVDEGAGPRAKQLAEDLAAERKGRGRDLSEHMAEVAKLERALATLEKQHATDVAALQGNLTDMTERANRGAIAHTQAEADMAKMREAIAAAEVARARDEKRIATQINATADALEKAEATLGTVMKELEQANLRTASAERSRKAAEERLKEMRARLRTVATAQLAAEDPLTLITGARMVALLRLNGSTARLLALTDHDDTEVVAAAARALVDAPDLEKAALPATEAALALLADESIAVRMAGLDLLRKTTGKTIDFDPGASPDKRAAVIATLKKLLEK